MKKLIALVLAILVIALSACKSGEKPADVAKDVVKEASKEMPKEEVKPEPSVALEDTASEEINSLGELSEVDSDLADVDKSLEDW